MNFISKKLFMYSSYKKIFGLILLLVVFLMPFSVSLAGNVFVAGIDVSDIENGTAELRWRTSGARTKAVIYIGEDEDNLDDVYKYNSYDYSHYITLKNLEKNKTYFYKIVVIESSGEETETFLRSFSTKNMEDTIRPFIEEFSVVKASNQCVLLRWETNEETKVLIEYGKDLENLNKSYKMTSYKSSYEKIICSLEEGVEYDAKLTAYDRDGNYRTAYSSFTAYGSKSDANLEISKITPASIDDDAIKGGSVEISFKTSLPARSKIYYGTSSGSLKKTITVSENRNLYHGVTIEGLTPNTTYFFKISAYDSFYSKSTKTAIMSFATSDVSYKYPNGCLVRARGDYKVYFINGNTKAWIKTSKVFSGLGYQPSWVWEVSSKNLDEYEEISAITSYKKHPNGTLVKYLNSPTVYLIEEGKKRPIASPEVFERLGLKWDWIMNISDSEKYTTGDYIN